jgi:hypothetical protein
MAEFNSTRGDFLRTTGKGAVGLVAGGTVLAMAQGVAFGAAAGPTDADVEIAKVAATAELLAIDVYTRAINAGIFSGATRQYLINARKNERDHYGALAGLLGDAAPKALQFKYPAGTFKSASKIVNLGVTLETAFVSAYMTAAKALTVADLRLLAAQVGANEASHLGFLLNAQGKGKTLASVPKVLNDAQFKATVKTVTGFIK